MRSNKKILTMLLGNLLVGIAVGFFRKGALGVDPFSCMNLGICGFLNLSFGTWQFLVNFVLLFVVFFNMRSCIGIGTVVNMVGIGYISDFVCYIIDFCLGAGLGAVLRILLFVSGALLASLGAALYMEADLGVAPYDSIAMILERYTNGKISFRIGRILSDIICVVIGISFSVLSGRDAKTIAGIGTIFSAFMMGPFIQMFRSVIKRG